jgi:hypothetical protein
MTGHERSSVPGEHEDPARADSARVRLVVCGSVTAPVLCRLRRRGGALGVTPTGPGTAPVGLPSPMFHAGAPRGGGESVSRFVPAPRGVCSHGFQSRPLRKHGLVGLLAHGKRSHRGTSLISAIAMTGAGHSASVRRGGADSGSMPGERVASFPKCAIDARDRDLPSGLDPTEVAHSCEQIEFVERVADLPAIRAQRPVRSPSVLP